MVVRLSFVNATLIYLVALGLDSRMLPLAMWNMTTLTSLTTGVPFQFLVWLRIASYLAYLIAWVAVSIASSLMAIPSFVRLSRKQSSPLPSFDFFSVGGLLLQVLSLAVLTLLHRPPTLARQVIPLLAVVVAAPVSALLFVQSCKQSLVRAEPAALITTGPYGWVRNPIYLAMTGMLTATALIACSIEAAICGLVIFVVGTILRIRSEEECLLKQFSEEYVNFCRKTPWRIIPLVW